MHLLALYLLGFIIASFYMQQGHATSCLVCRRSDLQSPQCSIPIRLTDFAPNVTVQDFVEGGTLQRSHCYRSTGCGRIVFTVNEESFVTFGCSQNSWSDEAGLNMDDCRRNEKIAVLGKLHVVKIVSCFRCDKDYCNSPESNALRATDWNVPIGTALVGQSRILNLGFVVGNVSLELKSTDGKQ